MLTYEQIGVCYKIVDMHARSITYFKKALQMAYEINDQTAELYYYEILGKAYMNAGNPDKMVKYQNRSVNGLVDPPNGHNRQLSHYFIQ